MKNNEKELIKARDIFRECADIIDEILDLGARHEKGEDVKKELESTTGRYLLKMMSLESM
ncbi:hypothetical protein PU629_07150 [Pullulanibacillus sp. KACC 23026]|uniref:hypothetical protein n=1 Tax=Pullulanibacillus sp. KACC 23026 TaxID=3028315 RepID=UPI0023B0BFB2|nr:hypothetical protein [Pullulanibacillus sp. KACC 23026]WEG14135.1 hypothetical protein PU629_07150 [Pullulanibacillus sp. KACC 23026]